MPRQTAEELLFEAWEWRLGGPTQHEMNALFCAFHQRGDLEAFLRWRALQPIVGKTMYRWLKAYGEKHTHCWYTRNWARAVASTYRYYIKKEPRVAALRVLQIKTRAKTE